MNILNRQTRIRLVEPDRRAICARCEVNELLKILSAGGGWRALGELEQEVENLSNVLREVSYVRIEGPVIYREEANLVIF